MTADVDFDRIDIEDDDENDHLVRIKRDDLKALRDSAKTGRKAARELEEVRRERAVRDAGLDLSAKQQQALSRLVEDPTPENLRAEAEALGWVQATPDPEAEQRTAEVEAIGTVAAAANGANEPLKATFDVEDYRTWSVDKRMRLQEQHPDIAEALLRGDTNIRIPAGF